MFQRLESVLHSEISSLGHPRAALLGFAVSLLAYNVLALISRFVEQSHQPPSEPSREVSTFHLALSITASYQGMLIAVPPEHWAAWRHADPAAVAGRLRHLSQQLASSQMGENEPERGGSENSSGIR